MRDIANWSIFMFKLLSELAREPKLTVTSTLVGCNACTCVCVCVCNCIVLLCWITFGLFKFDDWNCFDEEETKLEDDDVDDDDDFLAGLSDCNKILRVVKFISNITLHNNPI